LGFAPLAGALPLSIARALATPANNQTGTIQDVEHIIILTQGTARSIITSAHCEV
jgi:phospholipase C